MKKRKFLNAIILAALLQASIAVYVIPDAVRAAQSSGECGSGVRWSYSSGTLTISGNGDMYDYSTDFQPWIDYSSNINNIVISDGVNSIGAYAFYNMSGLSSCSVPDSVSTIKENAFSRSKTNLTIYTDSGSYAYMYAQYENIKTRTATYTTDINPTSYGDETIYTQSTGAYIDDETFPPNGIENGSFAPGETFPQSSGGLVTIPVASAAAADAMPDNTNFLNESSENQSETSGTGSSVTATLQTDANDYNREEIERGSDRIVWNVHGTTLTISGSGAMPDYSNSSETPWHDSINNITKIVISDGVTSIGKNNFTKFKKLTDVELPQSLNKISENAFYDCTKLTSISIPSSVMDISSRSIAYYFDNGDHSTKVRKSFIIYGEPGSKAEKYANDNNIVFVKKIEKQSIKKNTDNSEINGSRKSGFRILAITGIAVVVAFIFAMIYYSMQRKGKISKIAEKNKNSVKNNDE